jgi:hypothetical protein
MAGLFGNITDAFGLTNWQGQEDAMANAAAYFNSIPLPEQKLLELERLVMTGELTPEMAQTILLESTAFEKVRTDPKLKEAQYEALMGLQERAKEGLTAEDRYQLAKIKQEEDTAARGSREAIIQQAAMQGRSGGGLEMLSKMQNQQDSASRQAMRDAQVAALSQQQKMEALLQSGNLAGSMEQSDYQRQADLAKARDYIDQFNVANQNQTERMNVGTRNAAQESELAERRRVANANLGLRNQEILYNAQLPQQAFQNQMAIAGGKAGTQYKLAEMYGQQGQANLGMGAGIAAAIAASDIRAKKNIDVAPEEIDELLNSLTGYKFEYKNPEKHGAGERLGVMAQDIENTKMGEDIVKPMPDDPEVKGLDTTKVLHAILASVGRLNERLDAMEGKYER